MLHVKTFTQMVVDMTAKRAMILALALPIGILSTKAYADRWDGLFLGVNTGDAQMSSAYTTGPVDFRWAAASIVSQDMWNNGRQDRSRSGAIAGLSAAYNVQDNSFVYGAEIGLNAVNLQQGNTDTYQYTSFQHYYTYTQEARVDNLLTLRGRAGYAFDRSLLSVTGGIAVTSLKTGVGYFDDYSGIGRYSAAETKTRVKVGWTAGIAYECRLQDDIALKAEYDYVDFGKTSATPPILDGAGQYEGGLAFSSRVHMNIFTLGVEKKF